MRNLICFLTLAFLFPAIAGAFPSWSAVGIGSHDVDWTPGGSGTLAVVGTFGGATVTFFWCAPIPGPTLECFEVNATACTFTSRGSCNFSRGPGTLRLTVTGGTPLIDAVAAGPTQASASGGGGGGGSLSWTDDGLVATGQDPQDLLTPIVTLSGTDATFGARIFTGDGALGAPAYSFSNDTDVGMFASSGALFFGVDSNFRIKFDNGGNFFNNFHSTGWQLNNLASSSTVPTIIPNRSDTTTGLCYDTVSGGVCLTDNATAVLLATTTSVTISDSLTLGLPSSASPPTACSASVDGHVYWDTGQSLVCRCDSVSWTGVAGGVVCV